MAFSNTLKLKVLNWKGINIEGSYNRTKRFFTQRTDDLTLNNLIGPKPNTFIDFFETPDAPLVSTVSEVLKKNTTDMYIQKIATVGLADLCEKYYLKRPSYMSVDVEGVGQYTV